MPFTPDLDFIARRLRTRWSQEWRAADDPSRLIHSLRPRLPPPKEAQLRARRRRATWSRAELSSWHGLRLRASRLNEHLHRVGLRPSPDCACGFPSETPLHFLMRCPRHADAREQLLATINRHQLPSTITSLLACDRSMPSSRDADALDASMRRYLTATRRFE